MLDLQNVSYSYPKSKAPVFDGLSLSFPAGGIYGLLGSNGAGKSTLLYLMCGLIRSTSGLISFDGTDVSRRLPSTLGEIFLVPEEFDLPSVKLDEFISVNAPFYPRFSRDDMNRYLGEFRLTPDLHLGRLSMGQKKKAFIAFALACHTSLILMDEPTNGLDIPGKSEFRRAIVSAMTDDRTIIISTHQVRDLDRILDHVTIVEAGRSLINCPMARIQERLSFTLEPTFDPSALFSSATAGGYATVRLNNSEAETDVNLESLFELAIEKTELIKEILK